MGEHAGEPFLVRDHRFGVAFVAVRIVQPVADAGDRHYERVLAGLEIILLHKAREALCFRRSTHAHTLDAGLIHSQPIPRAFQRRPLVHGEVADMYAADRHGSPDGLHQVMADHWARYREWRSIYRRRTVRHDVHDDDEVAFPDAIAHSAAGRCEDELADSQLPQNPHEKVHRVAVSFVHVDAPGNHEYSLAADDRDADHSSVTRQVGERAEERMDVCELHALDELDGPAPAGAEHRGSFRADGAELGDDAL